MRISRRFEVDTHDSSDELGFMPTWIKGAEPFQRVAHDMLEHFLVPQCNAAEAELMALGAMLVMRIDGGARLMKPEENLAVVLQDAMEDWVYDNHENPRPLTTRRLDNDWADAVITLAVPKGFAMVERNFSDSEPVFDSKLQLTVVSWMRAGVRACYRRYQRANTDLYTVGDYIFKKLDDFSWKLIDSDDLKQGDQVVITADIDACEFFATVNGQRW